MKLLASVSSLLLAGFAAGAAQDTADVYILGAQRESSSSSSTPSIPRQIARQILLQRLGADHDSLLDDIPQGVDENQAVSYLNQFGKALPPLFGDSSTAQRPAQAVIFVEGVTDKEAATLRDSLHASPSFSIAEPPRSKAIHALLNDDLPRVGVSSTSCGIEAASNPYDASCWSKDETFVASYDLKKAPETIDTLLKSMGTIQRLVEQGELEIMLLLMPETSRSSAIARWTSKFQQSNLHARAIGNPEAVMSEQAKDAVPAAQKSNTGASANIFAPPKKIITAITCFKTFDLCMEQTGNCTGGHGKCVDKYLTGGQQRRAKDEEHCFKCHCQPTVLSQGKDGQYERTEVWGGAMCQKKDISVPFWLILGFSVTIIGAITFAIGLLFQVGEQKLPGVIGAGVSRSK